MADYGLIPTGFLIKSRDVIETDILGRLRGKFGPNFGSGNSLVGRVVSIFSDHVGEVWEVCGLLWSATSRDGAVGVALDNVGLLTGAFRGEATSATAILTLTGTPGSPVAAGSRASNALGKSFATADTVVIASYSSWVASTAYVASPVASRVTNSGQVYLCIASGTSAGSGGPTTTSQDITDGTVHWRWLGAGGGAIDVSASAVVPEALLAESGTIVVIDTPVSGWSGATNILDSTEGFDRESDESYRLSQEQEFAQVGASTNDAIRAEILQILGVTSCTVFDNRTDATDVDGLPPHSIEVLVRGGDDTAIANAIFAHAIGGLALYGSTTINVTDSEGTIVPIKFTRPTEINAAVKLTLVKDAATYPADGNDQIIAAVVAAGNARGNGVDIVASRNSAAAFTVTGVLDVTSALISSAVSPSVPATPTLSTTIGISKRQIAVYDSTRVTLIVTSGTP